MDGHHRGIYAHILFQLLVVYHCRAARVIIDDFSPRVTYNTRVLQESTCKFNPGNSDCDGTWWFEYGDDRGEAPYGGQVHTTRGPGTNATFEFQGPSVAMYGIALLQCGAQAIVTIDLNAPVRVSFNISGEGARLVTRQLLFSTSALDPSVSHTITVAYDDSTFQPGNPAWMSIDYFEVDEPSQESSIAEGATQAAPPEEPATSSSGTRPEQSSRSAPTALPEGPAGANVSSIVGAVIGTLAGVLLAGLILFLTRRRLRLKRNGENLSRRLVSPLLTVSAPVRSAESSPSAVAISSPFPETFPRSPVDSLSFGGYPNASDPPPYSPGLAIAHMTRGNRKAGLSGVL